MLVPTGYKTSPHCRRQNYRSERGHRTTTITITSPYAIDRHSWCCGESPGVYGEQILPFSFSRSRRSRGRFMDNRSTSWRRQPNTTRTNDKEKGPRVAFFNAANVEIVLCTHTSLKNSSRASNWISTRLDWPIVGRGSRNRPMRRITPDSHRPTKQSPEKLSCSGFSWDMYNARRAIEHGSMNCKRCHISVFCTEDEAHRTDKCNALYTYACML